MPLPRPDATGDKNTRGRVLAVGGSRLVPGAVQLAGVAALRAGAGKLQLATVQSVASQLGMAVPEALIVSLPATRRGEIAGASAGEALRRYVRDVDALLVGPGMMEPRGARALLRGCLPALGPDVCLVLDAAAILALAGRDALPRELGGRVILTPHAGEMAALMDIEKTEVERAPRTVAVEAAARFGAVVVLKGSESWIATPDGDVHRYSGGSVGLATSGSGDTLAGIVAGLAARGAAPLRAAIWGTFLHGAAGVALARRVGPIGFLARELLDEIPALMHRLR